MHYRYGQTTGAMDDSEVNRHFERLAQGQETMSETIVTLNLPFPRIFSAKTWPRQAHNWLYARCAIVR